MNEPLKNYKKIEVDNPICNRRFHLAFEEGRQPIAKAEVLCPHCGSSIYLATNHPPILLTRDENLIKAPDNSRQTMKTCQFTST